MMRIVKKTRMMRSKENANDYRYFPDPDLCPVVLSETLIDSLRASLPELPQQKKIRFEKEYGLSAYDANLLITDRAFADYLEAVVHEKVPAKLAVNWIMGDFSGALNKENLTIDATPLSASRLAGLLRRIADETISSKIAKTLFEQMWASEASADELIEAQGLRQVTDETAIATIIDRVLAENPQQLADYRAGKDRLYGYFVGQVMKASGGKLNPQQLNALLKQKLEA